MQRVRRLGPQVALAVIVARGRAVRWAIGGLALLAFCASVVLTDSHTVAAAVTPGVKPDITLSPGNRTFQREYSTVLVNDLTPQVDPSVVPTPDQCRDLPPLDVFCDVYRIKIVRDRSPDASNFVQLLVSWDRMASTPALALVAAGLGDSDVPDIDLFLYDKADAYLDFAEVGGRGAVIPERMVWEATQDEYDLVVRAGAGVNTGYSMKLTYSNEIFDKPFELIEQLQGSAPAPATDAGDGAGAVGGGGGALGAAAGVPRLALAPVAFDSQIAGIGLGTTEQFDPAALGLPENTRSVATSAAAPSALALVAGLGLVPLAFGAVAVAVLRRRRDAFVS